MATGHYPLPDFLAIDGVKIGTAVAGINHQQDDLTLIQIDEGASVAAVFTQNAFCAAPVIKAKAAIAEATPRYLIINTGNANAGTGSDGLRCCDLYLNALSTVIDAPLNTLLPFSTGVIGEPLPHQKIIGALNSVVDDLHQSNWSNAAHAIMTTDTRPKGVSNSLVINDKLIKFSGISKGAGMIKPNMATMLAFAATDLKIDQDTLQRLLVDVNAVSFNSITVDSDTSTNDAVVLMATGKSQVDYHALSEDSQAQVYGWLKKAFIQLAQLIVRDAEGATKFISVIVEEGRSIDECRQLAYAIAHSPLVKTAFFASDPNWGRLLMAIGKADLPELDINQVSVYINDRLLVSEGQKAKDFTESVGQALFQQEEIEVKVKLRRGQASTTIWTSDFSFDYVKINAEYRT